jgi:hypothetical protein
MARRPNHEKVETLSEEELKELRHNLAPERPRCSGLLRAGLPGLSSRLQPPSESAANADLGAGVETAMEVALNLQKETRMNFAAALRAELAERAQQYAQAEGVPHCLSYGEAPTVCFAPCEHGSRHGNFLQRNYTVIQANPAWRKRLSKVHTQGRRFLPDTERGRWMELDSCTSSDALLMNVFCYPVITPPARHRRK